MWMLRILQVCISFVWHIVMAIWYRGKGKTVPPVKNPLLLKSASELARCIREGKCKSEDVILAYMGRILEVEPYINAVVENCFEDALKKSREVDALIASGKYTKEQLCVEKPLLGIPISVKSLFHIKDMPCTAGSPLYSDLRGIEDAPDVAKLKNAGAIVIATTNVPELSMGLETVNRLYGRTCNPYDTNKTCGGSCGGEGALIGAGASLFGLGNDMLGSLRVPANFCGVFAHKASKGLVSYHGTFPLERPDVRPQLHNPEVYKCLVNGPMCRYAEDLITGMKVLAIDNEVRMKFDHQVDFKKMKIYYLKSIKSPGIVPVDRDVADALKNAVSYFEKQYNIVAKEVEMPYLFEINRCIFTTVEPLFRARRAMIRHKVVRTKRKLTFLGSISRISKSCLNTFTIANFIGSILVLKRNERPFYQKMIESWMDEFNKLLDENSVLLLPGLPVPAPYHHETLPLVLSLCYTSLFNIVGLPSTHCPMGLTRHGLPCGVQIVGRHNNDPLTIACAVELEKAFGGWKVHDK